MVTINTIKFQITTTNDIVEIEVPDFLVQDFTRTVIWQSMPHQVNVISSSDESKSIAINF